MSTAVETNPSGGDAHKPQEQPQTPVTDATQVQGAPGKEPKDSQVAKQDSKDTTGKDGDGDSKDGADKKKKSSIWMTLVRLLGPEVWRRLPRRYRVGIPAALIYILVGLLFVCCPFLFSLPGRLAPLTMDAATRANFDQLYAQVAYFDAPEGPVTMALNAVAAQKAIVDEVGTRIPWFSAADPEDKALYDQEKAVLEERKRDLAQVNEERERAMSALRGTQGVFSPLCVSETRELFTSVFFGWERANTKVFVNNGVMSSIVEYTDSHTMGMIAQNFGVGSAVGIGKFLLQLPFWLAEYNSNPLSYLIFWVLASAGAVTFVGLFFVGVIAAIFVGLLVFFIIWGCLIFARDWIGFHLGLPSRPNAHKHLQTGAAAKAAAAKEAASKDSSAAKPNENRATLKLNFSASGDSITISTKKAEADGGAAGVAVKAEQVDLGPEEPKKER